MKSGYHNSLLAKGLLKPEDHEPDVGPFEYYLDAFYELSSCRINGMGVGPIPFTAIADYSRLFEVEDFFDFHFLIRVMDRKFLEMAAQDNAGKKGTKK